MKRSRFSGWTICVCLAAALLSSFQISAQHLTLEGQTGGFLTPTAYVVYTDKGHLFSHPAIGYHFVNTAKVIGNVQTVSIVEGLANRAEIGYTRSIHTKGESVAFSGLWDFPGLNIVSGKVVLVKDGQSSPLTPGLAVGGLVRFQDKFVTGALDQEFAAAQGVAIPAKSYTNGDVYVAASKTWTHAPLPFLLNLGWKATNAEIFGLGGQSSRFIGRVFGGLGIPIPIVAGVVAVPSFGFTQEAPQVKNLNAILVNTTTGQMGAPAHIPTTLDYAVRITQRERPHFSIDIGVGQVAGVIGQTPVVAGGHVVGLLPVDLQAKHVVGLGLSYRY